MDMKEGILIWNENAGRPDIRYRDGTYYGGLHSGNTLEALIQGKWRPVRVEFNHFKDIWNLAGAAGYFDNILWLTLRN